MYPDCDTNPTGCFERYVRDRLEHMKEMKLSKLKIGMFDDTYDEQFKKIQKESGGSFWWQPLSINVGTIKDSYKYVFTLYYNGDQSLEKPLRSILKKEPVMGNSATINLMEKNFSPTLTSIEEEDGEC